ncbi:hypothetical protein MRX96_033629 [Rhipicephalus microplus]
MSGRPFRGGRRGGGFYPRAPYRGRGRGFRGGGSYEGRGRGRGRGGYGYNKRYDDDRDRDRPRGSPGREKVPTREQLQEIAAAVTKSIVQEKEQRLRAKTPVRTRSGFADSPPALASTRRSLSPVRGDGGSSPFSSSRDYPVSRPKTPSLKQKDLSGDGGFRDYPVTRPKTPSLKQKDSSGDGGFRDYPVTRPKTPSLKQKDSSGDGGFRAQLLELALKEKQKLGLDKLDSPRSSSSALKAIQGYSGTRSPEESDHEEEPIALDLYDDLPKPLFPISTKGSAESMWENAGSKQGSSLNARKKPIDDIFDDVDEYHPRHDDWDDRKDDRRDDRRDNRRDGKGGGPTF